MAWSAPRIMSVSAKCCIALLWLASPATAETFKAPLPWNPDTPAIEEQTSSEIDDIQTLRRVELYLNSLTTMVATFTQSSPDGNFATGTMLLKRPGKMRWQYDPPTPVVMYADGTRLVYVDYELDQINYVDIEDSLAALLTRKRINFADDELRVIHFRRGADSIRFTVLDARQPNEGRVTLEFTDNPLSIERMSMTDAAGQIVHVTFKDQQYGVALKNDLFVFDDPRKSRLRNYRR
ncbi:MAG: outer membrane lipoprotein carrier protein LolA [Rickettsiales bacterium]|nr:outer membrane lipoprotein carrier protein LolA [Rickettsiales bacterium]